MVLTKFVELKHVQEKFNAEFNSVFDDKYKPKFYTKTPNGGRIKDNFGIYFEFLDGNVKLICDSTGRKKMISSIEDLIDFFVHGRYHNELCWFYDTSFDFKTLMKYLPEQQLKELETSGETEYYVYTISYKDKNFFQINNKHNSYYKFYNLFPFFNLPLDDAAIKYLNSHRSDLVLSDNSKNDVNYWNNNQYRITNNCIEKAKSIQNLARYAKDNNIFPNRITHKKIINVPKTTNYPLVGTAFDYLLRFLIKAYNPKAITNQWRAEKSLDILKGRKKKIAKSIIETAKNRYEHFLDEKEINDDLIISSLLLAKIDGVVWGNDLENIDLNVDPADVDDLKNLIMGVPKNLYIAKNHCFLNPTFGPASILVGGADADLFIDNILIDIKTTKNPKFTRLFFNQLMGYVILHYLGRLYSNNMKKIDPKGIFKDVYGDFDNGFLNMRIEKIGIYFPRFNNLYTIDLKDVLPKGEMNLEILKWFEHEAHKAYQPMILNICKMKNFF